AVLEPLQPLQQQRLGVARPDVSDDPAHVLESKRARLSDRSAPSRADQPSSSSTSRETLPQRASDSSSVGASARTRTTGSVPEGRTSTRPPPFSSSLTRATASSSCCG